MHFETVIGLEVHVELKTEVENVRCIYQHILEQNLTQTQA